MNWLIHAQRNGIAYMFAIKRLIASCLHGFLFDLCTEIFARSWTNGVGRYLDFYHKLTSCLDMSCNANEEFVYVCLCIDNDSVNEILLEGSDKTSLIFMWVLYREQRQSPWTVYMYVSTNILKKQVSVVKCTVDSTGKCLFLLLRNIFEGWNFCRSPNY